MKQIQRKIIDYILSAFMTEKQAVAYMAVYLDRVPLDQAKEKTGFTPHNLAVSAARAKIKFDKYYKFANFVIGEWEKYKKSQSGR